MAKNPRKRPVGHSAPLARAGSKRRRPKSNRPARRDVHGSGELRALSQPVVSYEVETHGDDLRAFVLAGSTVGTDRRARRCYEILTGSSHPCVGCPALSSARSPSPRRETAVLETPLGPYRVAFAEPISDGRFRLQMVQLSEATVSSLQRAHIDRKARQAGLSRRELNVLDLLLLGRISAEIARALGITERTARFHVSNILAKLEADSRADLLRLLL
jgi:DNA-binding CsgD family transcriptional regulator